MKVLIYNFVQPDEPGKQGGGVAVYQKNLIQSLVSAGHDVISLSSGDRYSVIRRAPYLREENPRGGSGRLRRLFIYNSPVFAPAHSAFYNLDTYVQNTDLDRVADDLWRRFGNIDVFHFQNIEGLSASFFVAIRRIFPRARLILSAHNYNAVCPQVNLWFRETTSCVDYRDGHACVNCIGGHNPHPRELNIRRMETILASIGVRRHSRASRAVEFAVRLPFRLRRMLRRFGAISPRQSAFDPTSQSKARTIVSPVLAAPYRAYRSINVELCRDVFNKVIAVSERTKQVLAQNGIPSDQIAVSYIGTAHHKRFLQAKRKTALQQRLHIAYLGYMRSDKGFFFLMECLHLIPDELAAEMEITIAAPYGTDWPIEQLKQIAHRFNAVRIHNGYTHASIDEILQNVDLGIVPVLWEDNLPQVAIEIVSRGIPILTSDRGGASEIASQPSFTFKAGSKHDFLDKLQRIASGTIPLAEFWRGQIRLVSMEEHMRDLMSYYEGEVAVDDDRSLLRADELAA